MEFSTISSFPLIRTYKHDQTRFDETQVATHHIQIWIYNKVKETEIGSILNYQVYLKLHATPCSIKARYNKI